MNVQFGNYSRLLRLNIRLLLEMLKLDAALILIGLVYVFGCRAELDLTVSKGIFLLVGFLFVAIMGSRVITQNTATLAFYLRLPIRRNLTLTACYVVLNFPVLVAFTILFILFYSVIPSHDFISQSSVIQRYFQVIFAFLFIKSLTINIMIAMNIHLALIAGYFGLLGGVLFLLSVLRELIMPVFVMDSFTLALLFLLSTYLTSFIAIKKIGLR